MTEDRRNVLEMLASGQITAEEADRLIGALQSRALPAPAAAATATTAKPAPKYLRVIVDANDKHDGPVHINVRVPILLLRAGVKLASLIPVQAQDRVNLALREQGVTFDISQIKPENLNELIDQLGDLSVDIDQPQDDVKVRIFAE
jgi:hypothetical protein